MGSFIASHNRRVIQPISNNHECNTVETDECPFDNKCLTANIVYKAVVSGPSKPDKKYLSIAETPFKDRFRNHTRDFLCKKYVNSIELSEYMWRLKNEKITASIKLNIMSIVHGTPKDGVFKSCLTEKFWHLKHFNDEHLLKCRHENKLVVKSVEKG